MKKGKFLEFKSKCQLIVRLKAIKSIKKLLYFFSSYINLQSSNLCSSKLFFYWHYDDKGIWSDGGLFDTMKLVIIAFTLNLTFIGLIDPRQFTSLMNCMFGSLAWLLKRAIHSYIIDFHWSDLSPR